MTRKFKFILDISGKEIVSKPYTLKQIMEFDDIEGALGKIEYDLFGCGCYEFCECGSVLENAKIIDTIQYTGLVDKNNKEIYEGDIVKYKFSLTGGTDQIIFRDGAFQLKNSYVEGVGYRTVKNVSDFCEVIGNIYEHPNLLNQNN